MTYFLYFIAFVLYYKIIFKINNNQRSKIYNLTPYSMWKALSFSIKLLAKSTRHWLHKHMLVSPVLWEGKARGL